MSERHLIIAEKPSAAKNFAKALGGTSGTFAGIEFEICASHGHLLEFKEPHEMVPESEAETYARWSLATIPWDLNKFDWKRKIKTSIDPKTKRKVSVKPTLDKIKNKAKNCQVVVIATDADPTGEGELIGWEIIEAIGWRGKVKRMDFVDESVPVIQDAFKSLRTLSSDKYQDGEFIKAESRTKFDKGSMQLTRIATLAARAERAIGDKIVVRQGRLKSVMVKLVGDQLIAYENYVRKPYYEVRFKDECGNVYKRKVEKDTSPDFQYEQKADAENEATKYSTGTVAELKRTNKKTAPPALLDLSKLSALLAKKGYDGEEVLTTYQKMYEANIVSYPRTEDHEITPEQFNEALTYVDKVADVLGVDKGLLTHRYPRKSHVKVGGSHGANRPDKNVPRSLDDLKKYGASAVAIYQLLGHNFLAMFGEDYQYESVYANLKEYPEFTTIVNVPKNLPSFKDIFDLDQLKDKDENADNEDGGNRLGTKANTFVYEGANRRPAYPTEEWLMTQLSKANVGTGSTKTSTLVEIKKGKNAMLNSKKGRLSMTDLGRISTHLLQNTMISSVKVTSDLFEMMERIGKFESNPDIVFQALTKVVQHDKKVMLENAKSLLSKLKLKPVESKQPQYEQKEKITGFSMKANTEVTFNRVHAGHRFSDNEIAQLLAGEVITFVGKNSQGESYEVKGSLDYFTFKGNQYFGFVPQRKSTKEHKVPDEWHDYVFSMEEKTKLLNGETIEIFATIGKKSNQKVNVRYGENSYKGNTYFGIIPIFNHKDLPDQWSGHVFTSEEKETLLNGGKLVVHAMSKKHDKSITAELSFDTKYGVKAKFLNEDGSTTPRVPDKWSNYVFSDEEKEALAAGKTIHIYTVNNRNQPYDVDVHFGEYEYNGRKRMGIIPHFGNRNK